MRPLSKENIMTDTVYTVEFIDYNNLMHLTSAYKKTAIAPFNGTVEFEVGKAVVTLRTTTTDPFDNRFLVLHETVWICSRDMVMEKFDFVNPHGNRYAEITPKK
jgi:hypothetical protein